MTKNEQNPNDIVPLRLCRAGKIRTLAWSLKIKKARVNNNNNNDNDFITVSNKNLAEGISHC